MLSAMSGAGNTVRNKTVPVPVLAHQSPSVSELHLSTAALNLIPPSKDLV